MINVIKDDFFDNPDLEREYFLNMRIHHTDDFSEYHANDVLVNARHDSDILAEFAEMLPDYEVQNGFKTYNWAIKNPYDALHVHHDNDDLIGIVYLNEHYEDTDGTVLLRHKETGTFYKDEELFGHTDTVVNLEERLNKDEFNINKWETMAFIPAKYNRLLIFNPAYYHTATRVFGINKGSARLVQVFHFRRKNEEI